MRKRRKSMLKGALLLLVLAFAAVTAYYYAQHRVAKIRYPVENYIETPEFGLFIKYVEKVDYEVRHLDREFSGFSEFLLNGRLPWTLARGILWLDYFYSDPYKDLDGLYHYSIHCEVFTSEAGMDKELFDSLEEVLAITLQGRESGMAYSSPTGSSYRQSDDSNVREWVLRYEWKPDFTPSKLVVALPATGEVEEAPVLGSGDILRVNVFNKAELSMQDRPADRVLSAHLREELGMTGPLVRIVHEEDGGGSTFRGEAVSSSPEQQGETASRMLVYEDYRWQVGLSD